MHHAPLRRIPVVAAVVATAVTVLAACGGATASGSGNTANPSPSSSSNARSNTEGGLRPAASGKIAEIDGDTLQVQSDESGQVAVAVTNSTTYTQTKATTLAAVTVGSCITASALTSTSSSSAANDGDADQPTAITAEAVTITRAVNGSCTRGFGASPGGGSFRGTFTGAPSNFRRPSNAASGSTAGGQPRRALGTSGMVTAVNGDTITVRAARRDPPSSATPSPTNSPTLTTVTVTVTSSTSYTETVAATRSALKVGLCLTATGTTGADGTVTANRVALSPATAEGCGLTFRRGGPGGGAGGPAGGTVTSGG